MRARRTEFGEAEIVVVTFAAPRVLPGYRKRFADPLRVVSDIDRVLYRAFGFGRGAVWRVWGWRAAVRYVQLLRQGHKLEKPTDDTLQLGGDAVVDCDGKLAWLYAGDGPDDRPSVDQILDAVRAIDRTDPPRA